MPLERDTVEAHACAIADRWRRSSRRGGRGRRPRHRGRRAFRRIGAPVVALCRDRYRAGGRCGDAAREVSRCASSAVTGPASASVTGQGAGRSSVAASRTVGALTHEPTGDAPAHARPIAVRARGTCAGVTTATVVDREALADRRFGSSGPAVIIEARDDRGRARLARAPPKPATCCSNASGRSATRARSAPTVDPVHAGDLQQPLHVDRRADGRRAREHRASVNIKERLDFSCALFDADGDLIANAPHMPVHLGSMGESDPAIIRRTRPMEPGDVYVLNAPTTAARTCPTSRSSRRCSTRGQGER